MKNALRIAATLGLGLTLGTGAALAGDYDKNKKTGAQQGADTSKAATSPSSLHDQDREFVMKAAADGLFEVQAGELVQSKASHSDVKSFAKKMVTDHGKANDELKTIASNKGLILPSTLEKDKQKMLDELKKISGTELDQKYMTMMHKDHEKSVDLFEKCSKECKDAELKTFASKTLTTLKDHLRLAKESQTKLDAMSRR